MERPNSKGSQNFIVGLFVFVALLVSVGFVVFMGKSVFGSEFRVRTLFDDVRGLNIGAPAFLAGIQVGRVSEMQFPGEGYKEADKKNKIVVILTIQAEHRTRIRRDTEVTITTQGMLGDKVIVLTAGDGIEIEDNQMLKARQPKELTEYFAKGSNLVDTLLGAAINLNVLLESVNHSGRVNSILENMDKSMANLAGATKALNDGQGSLGSMIKGGEKDALAQSLKALERILGKIDRGQGTLGALVNDPSLHEDLRILLGGAQRSTAVRFLLRQAISAGEDADKKEKLAEVTA